MEDMEIDEVEIERKSIFKTKKIMLNFESITDHNIFSIRGVERREEISSKNIHKLIVRAANYEKIGLIFDREKRIFRYQDNYSRRLGRTDVLSYLIPVILEAKKMIGKKPIFIDVVKIYIGFVLADFVHKPEYPYYPYIFEIDKQMALHLERIIMNSNKSEEELLEELFHHLFWSEHAFKFTDSKHNIYHSLETYR